MRQLLLLLALLFSIPCVAAQKCPTERGDVKDLLDSGANKILAVPESKTVEDLVKLVPPGKWTPALPRQPMEFEKVSVTAWIVGAKLETDSDFHVVIKGDSGQTMIAEFPATACVAKAPEPMRSQMIAARRAFLHSFGTVTVKFRTLPKPIKARLTGPIFFDRLHGQTGVAPDGIEIHPVLLFEPL